MTTTGSLPHEAATDLAAAFSGQVLRPGDEGYEDARKVHNGLIDKRPALIARCRGTADVVDAVDFARMHGLEVAVRGGGHNASISIRNGGLRGRKAGQPGAISTVRRNCIGWRLPAAWSRRPASPASPSAAVWAG